jgi:hypothetical protein
MPWGAAIAAGAAIGGDLIKNNAAKAAANKQAAAANAATALQKQQYDQTRTDNMPMMDARNGAVAQLQGLWGPNGSFTTSYDPTKLTTDPGYLWAQQQGQQALDRQGAAAGHMYSGAQLKAASEFNTGNATQYMDNAFNRQQAVRGSQTNALQSMAGLGQSAANLVSGSGANYANQAGQNMIGAGNAQAAAMIARGNGWANAMNSVGGMFSGGFGGQSGSEGNGNYGGTWSDVRLKADIQHLGIADNGLPLYSFRYVWSAQRHVGHMAQEVAQKFPEAVTQHPSGYLMVDYSKV